MPTKPRGWLLILGVKLGIDTSSCFREGNCFMFMGISITENLSWSSYISTWGVGSAERSVLLEETRTWNREFFFWQVAWHRLPYKWIHASSGDTMSPKCSDSKMIMSLQWTAIRREVTEKHQSVAPFDRFEDLAQLIRLCRWTVSELPSWCVFNSCSATHFWGEQTEGRKALIKARSLGTTLSCCRSEWSEAECEPSCQTRSQTPQASV